ncbi:hypothetical protein NQZ70_07947 [Sorangium sp. Soce836]|nr:hypothetical protein NQZ70_07947 [Sorangium sp. Soce836]
MRRARSNASSASSQAGPALRASSARARVARVPWGVVSARRTARAASASVSAAPGRPPASARSVASACRSSAPAIPPMARRPARVTFLFSASRLSQSSVSANWTSGMALAASFSSAVSSSFSASSSSV